MTRKSARELQAWRRLNCARWDRPSRLTPGIIGLAIVLALVIACNL